MSGIICTTCPLPAEISDITANNCPISWDQIQKIVLFRKSAESGLNWFTNVTDLNTEANWDTLLASAGDDKVVIGPYFNNLVFPQSEALESGGNDNTTINGIPLFNGLGSVNVTGDIKGASSETIRDLDTYTCESLAEQGVTNLRCMFIARGGKVVYTTNASDSTTPRGFELYNFVVSDVGSEGFNAKNQNNISWYHPGYWSRYWAITTPTFDILSK